MIADARTSMRKVVYMRDWKRGWQDPRRNALFVKERWYLFYLQEISPLTFMFVSAVYFLLAVGLCFTTLTLYSSSTCRGLIIRENRLFIWFSSRMIL